VNHAPFKVHQKLSAIECLGRERVVALTLILQQIGRYCEPYVRQSALQIGRVTVEWNARMQMMRLGVKRAGKRR
jgi:hypothetical protein